MFTLGINAAYHDPAAVLVKDGGVLAAAEEERFTRIKHGKRPIPFSTYELPFNAIDFCLREAGIRLRDVDHVAYSYDPNLLLPKFTHNGSISIPLEPSAHALPEGWDSPWEPLFVSSIVNAPRHLVGGYPHHLQARFRDTPLEGAFRWHFVQHHLAHAASAFFASPFQEAAVFTIDGRGEKATTSYAMGVGNHLEPLGEVDMPHSLGIFYEKITEYLGFLHSSDEYKVMALASFGKPAYLQTMRDLIRVSSDGQFSIGEIDLVQDFGPARVKGGPLEARHYDLAHSLQIALEETVICLTDWLYEKTGATNLAMAGGVALNCVMNSRIRDHGTFEKVWVQPAAGDAGTALGAALLVDAQEAGREERAYVMDHAFLGPGYSDDEIETFLKWSKVPYKKMENVAETAADLLAADKIIGWFQSRSEFGPRALGARSILASPIQASMQERLNEIKDREDFRPVAPVVLEEEVGNWFVNGQVSPFMLFVFDVMPDKADRIPAVRHVDGTARIQTINRAQNERYYDVLKAFFRKTGVPVLVNTSFNTRGEPIVNSPRDAIECFWTSPLDALVIGSYLLEKPEITAK